MRYAERWEPELRQRSRHAGAKVLGALVVLIFSGTLAYVVGNRLSDEALGVLAGAMCGVGSAVPLTLLVLLGARALRNGSGGQRQREPEPMYTRPMIVPPAMFYPQQLPPQQEQRQPATWHHVPRRQFEIVGDPED